MVYRCDICAEVFTSSWTLARHRKSEHKQLPLVDDLNVEGVVSLDEFSNEELSVLPKDVLAVYCSGDSTSTSHEILEVSVY